MADEQDQQQLTEMQIVFAQESWSTILLENGDTIKLKAVILSIHKVEGKTNQFGKPLYCVRTENVTDVRYNSNGGVS